VRSASPPATRDAPLSRLLALVVLCAAGVLILYLVAVRTEHGQLIDNKALQGRTTLDTDTLDVANRILETISVASLVAGTGALVFIGLVRGRLLLAIAVGVSIFGAIVTTEILKRVVFERPNLVDNVRSFGNTYPSGHATVAMALAVGAVLVAPRRLRGTAAVAGVVYASAVSTAVLITGWHRPSDAVAAAFVTVGWGAAVAAYLVALRGTGRELSGYRPLEYRPATWILTGAGALSLVLVTGAAGAIAYRAKVDDLFVVEGGKALTLALIAIIGADLLMIGVLLMALRGITLDPPRPVAARGTAAPYRSM
jgi:membrane-associated phospholipid phosphatase